MAACCGQDRAFATRDRKQNMLDNPLVQGAVVPFVVSLVLFLVAQKALGIAERQDLAVSGAAAAVGFLVAYYLILGFPAFPPAGATRKLFWICLFGLLLGLALDMVDEKIRHRFLPAVALLAPGAALAWLGWTKLVRMDLAAIGGLAVLWAAAGLVCLRFTRKLREAPGEMDPPIMILAAAFGTGGLALMFASASIGQLAFALAAALGAVLLWTWIAVIRKAGESGPLGLSGLFGLIGALLSLVTALALFSDTPWWALAILMPVFYADIVFAGKPAGDGPVARAVRPVLAFVAAMIPVMVVGAAVLIMTAVLEG